MERDIEKAAKNYADTMYRFEDRGVLYQETQNDFKAGAEYLKSLLLEKLQVYKGAMVLDGYEPEDSCIKFMNELIEEINGGEYSSWISVEERLPKKNELVLCRMKSNGAIVSGYIFISPDNYACVSTLPDFEFEDYGGYVCDMWRPMPE